MWANVLILGVIAGLTFAGFKRGLVHEITDWVTIIGAALISWRLYRPIGAAMHTSAFKGWTEESTYNCAFWLLFLPTALILLSIGLHLDRVSKEEQRFPEEVSKWSGCVLAFVKSLVLCSLFAVWAPNTDMMTPEDRSEFHRAPMVNFVRAANPLTSVLVAVVAPSDLAKQFDKAMARR